MSEHLITLATFMFPTEAYPLMAKIESEGIECFLDGENTVTAMPFLSNAIGGIKLNIKESDAVRALQILKEGEQFFKKEKQKKKSTSDKYSKGFVQVETFCPNCESINVYRKKFPLYKTILAIIFPFYGLPLVFMIKKHYCADCGHTFKQ